MVCDKGMTAFVLASKNSSVPSKCELALPEQRNRCHAKQGGTAS